MHAITWTNLKDIILSEISESQKHKYYREVKFTRQKVEVQLPVSGKEDRVVLFNGIQSFSFARVLEIGCTIMPIVLNTTKLYA